MAPGETHSWFAWPFDFGDVVDLMAHAVYGSGEPDRELIVETIYTKVDGATGRQVFFNVKNVGNSYIPGYNVASSVISK